MRIRVRFTGPLLAAVSFASLFVCSGMAAAQFVTPATQGIGPALVNASAQGLLPDSTPIHINIGLQIQNRAALVSYVQSITTPGNLLYGQELQPADFVAFYAGATALPSAASPAGFHDIILGRNGYIPICRAMIW